MTLMNTARRRISHRPRSLLRSASMLLALVFVLLRPVCEAFAASGDRHAPAEAKHGYVQMADPAAGGYSDDGICCASVDAQALTTPATPPLSAGFAKAMSAPSAALRETLIPTAPAMKFIARHDPSPPLPYHARSLRRLD
jgi:hypothetical protein